MNVLLPIAGSNKAADTEYIRSLMEIERKTVLQYVMESLSDLEIDRFVVVVNRKDMESCRIDDIVRLLRPDARIVVSEGGTKGAACSCLLAIDELDLNDSLLIVNGEQLVLEPLPSIVRTFEDSGDDGGILIFDDVHPRWSFVRTNEQGYVTEAAEKRPISRNATAGIYYFRKARDFVSAAMASIRKDATVNGKFYICPVYNELILEQKRIGTYRIPKSRYINFRYEDTQNAEKLIKEYRTEGNAC